MIPRCLFAWLLGVACNNLIGQVDQGNRPDTLSSYIPSYGPFYYSVHDGTVTIERYDCQSGGATPGVVVPDAINGLPVTSLGDRAFYGCQCVTNVTIPDSVTTIIGWAFSYSTNLVSVALGKGVTNISEVAFSDSPKLVNITVDPGNPAFSSLEGILFDKPRATLVRFPAGKAGGYTVPGGVTRLGDLAFYTCHQMTSVIIPASVTSIGAYAFSHCTSLSGIVIPESVSRLGEGAFYNCTSLTNVAIPKSVADIGSQTFWSCTGLTNVTLSNGLSTIGDGAFNDCTALVQIVIPDSVTTVGAAFSFCQSLAKITIGSGVTSMGIAQGCYKLTEFQVHPLNTTYSSLDGVLFDKGRTKLIQFPVGKLGGYTIPEGVTNLAFQAFLEATNLTSVRIPGSLAVIEDYAFQMCANLAELNIPDRITTIGQFAFSSTKLSNVIIPDSVVSLGPGAFAGCQHLASVTAGTGLKSIPEMAFQDCTRLTSVIMSDHVASIEGSAFSGCTSLVDLRLPSGLTNIAENAFRECSSLESVTIPSGVTEIRAGTFARCASLRNLAIPVTVNRIGKEAFAGSGLTSITISHAVIDDNAFTACWSLTTVILGNGVTSMGTSAFADCINLTHVTLPDRLTSIPVGAFDSCVSLAAITIPSSVTQIGSYAFQCFSGSLKEVYFEGNAPILGERVFAGSESTMYYLPGTTGWGPRLDVWPTALWVRPNPTILDNDPGFGLGPDGFGFTVSWATNSAVVIEAAADLVNPVWLSVATNTLAGGTSYFSDPQWSTYPRRFYRVRAQ